jgi:hypothetical protein
MYETMTAEEVCDTLKISFRTLKGMANNGQLVPCFARRQKLIFRKSEVMALRAARAEGINLYQTYSIALAALSTARRVEAQLGELLSMMGLDSPILPRDRSSVESLRSELEKEVDDSDIRHPDFLKTWGGIFFAIDETYLELVAHITGDPDPWRAFHNFGVRIMKAIIRTNDVDMYRAAAYFRAARDHLGHVCYLHCRQMYGRKIANTLFTRKTPAVDEIYALLH